MDLNQEWDPIKMAESSTTFCAMPWAHQYINMDGKIKACCIYQTMLGDLKQHTLKEIWNSDQTKTLRLKMLKGEKPIGCKMCTSRTDINLPSMADDSNDWLFDVHPNDPSNSVKYDVRKLIASTDETGHVEEHRLYYMDTRFNNLCNLSCRTCNSEFSTSWIADSKKLKEMRNIPIRDTRDILTFSGKYETDAFEQIKPHLNYANKIYFAGGEPMMQEDHYNVLKELISLGRKNIELRYNTNLSRLKLGENDVIELWKNFKRVEISASLDANHERAEYWRKGTKWNLVVDNIQRIKREVPHVNTFIMCSVGWPNAFNALELHKEWVELGYIDLSNFIINFVDGPSFYSLRSLPDWKKQIVKEKYLEHVEWIKSHAEYNERVVSTFMVTIDLMMRPSIYQTDKLLTHYFTKETEKLDLIRGEDFWKVFPEHADLKEYMELDENK